MPKKSRIKMKRGSLQKKKKKNDQRFANNLITQYWYSTKKKKKNLLISLIRSVGSQFVAQAQKIWDMSPMNPIQ